MEVAELLAIKESIAVINQLAFGKVIIEGDAAAVINSILSEKEDNSDVRVLVDEVRAERRKLEGASLVWTKRSNNKPWLLELRARRQGDRTGGGGRKETEGG
ncbi:hypothetical protein ACH5RR_015754 [Cinchona calisaya]|uniref:RNase H type-1 domain-containing protein n=1 Tax=Cinchona calisaya TaxID=153742 RepID=A0ABD2ZTZ4_9GENT